MVECGDGVCGCGKSGMGIEGQGDTHLPSGAYSLPFILQISCANILLLAVGLAAREWGAKGEG
jgi:hypothetical protein